MEDNRQTTHGTASRSFAQEMQQAFAEWVRKLPFMKKNIPADPDLERQGEVPADRASAPRPAEGVPPGRPAEKEGRPG